MRLPGLDQPWPHPGAREQPARRHDRVHGAAPGADTLAGEAVRLRRVILRDDVTEERHPADWAKHGRAAGPIRNREMLASGIDRVYAFRLPGDSPGTDHMVRIAQEAGVPVDVIGPQMGGAAIRERGMRPR